MSNYNTILMHKNVVLYKRLGTTDLAKLTLLDIMIVSKALFEALMATLSVVACSRTSRVCRMT